MAKFYITTSIAYVNAPPHIGFAMELIQADVLARYHRLMGDEVFYLTGTDEHGSKMRLAAKEKGVTPQELADRNTAQFQALKELLDLSSDDFIRTSSEKHKKGAEKLWRKLVEKGDIYKAKYQGYYCVGCEAFVQEKDLVEGKCPNHQKEPEVLEEENYFFRVSKYSNQIKSLIERDEIKIVPEKRKHEILAVLKEGLRDTSFSRPKKSLDWGIKVPGDPKQTMYVWCDALSNYITALDYEKEGPLFKKFWPADVHLIGKDILRFHAGIWPAMLISAGISLPRAIYVHGFITSEGQKMSKSLGNIVDPVEMVKKYGACALRYYLLREIPTLDDGNFSQKRFQALYEGELADSLGNLLSRVLGMTELYFQGKVPEAKLEPRWPKRFNEILMKWKKAIENFDLKSALEEIFILVEEANKYVEEEKPWVLKKENPDRLKTVIVSLLETLRVIGWLIFPFLPATASKIHLQLGVKKDFKKENLKDWGRMKKGQLVKKGPALFPKTRD